MCYETGMAGDRRASPDDPIGLDDAYNVETPDDSRRLYAKWAQTYDTDFVEANGYVYHRNVVARFVDAGGAADGPVLDVGCGTGIVGEALRDAGQRPVDGIDISPEMLAVAATKLTDSGDPVYRNLVEADLTGTIAIPDRTYSAIVSVGAFTHGHLKPDAMAELLRVAAPNALCAVGINELFYVEQGFEAWFDRQAARGLITEPTIEPVVVYEAMEGEEADRRGNVAVFRVLG